MTALALLVLPIGLIWVLAYFLWRASQLRQVSEVLMQSAMRLIRPQDIATEGLTTIAQAVRSEVDLLVGGVEHAVQRAAVLEEIVHKEIAAIERAFGGNEERIRSLVTGIENQRAAFTRRGWSSMEMPIPSWHGSKPTRRTSITCCQCPRHAGPPRNRLRDTASGLARVIDDVAGRAHEAGDEISAQTTQMERMSGLMIGELRDFSRQLASQVEQLSHAANTLNAETSEFGHTVTGMEASMAQLIRHSIEQLTDINGTSRAPSSASPSARPTR